MTTDLDTALGTVDQLAANVRQAWDAADTESRLEGAQWYANAHALASELDPSDPARAAAVIAVLSPQQGWERNVTLAKSAYQDGCASGTVGTFCRRADAIMDGADPDKVLGGPKVRAFWHLIADPSDDWHVCVDRHAVDIALGEVRSQRSRKVLERAGAYERVAAAYRQVAAELGVLPSEVQAVTWCAWRRAKAGLARNERVGNVLTSGG